MQQDIDICIIPFTAGIAQRDMLFDLYCLLLRPYIETIFGWDDIVQRTRFEVEYPDSSIKLIQVDTIIAGFISTRFSQNSLHVSLLLLLPEFQCSGIGSFSMHYIQAEARVNQLPVTLSCFSKNHRALSFYKQLGYQIVESDDHFVNLLLC
jgi:ribosomal protein S18 acetylase RimI-like enzyme